MPVLRIGTRGSQLALVQSQWVAEQLEALEPDLEVRLEVIDSKPVLKPDNPALGDGIFVKEIQMALLGGKVDAGVHSLKDLPTAPVEGLTIAAIPPRADPREALVGSTLDGLPQGARVGTSSPRRTAQLRYLRPDLEVSPLNGNLATRISKVASGEYAAAMLAAAGLARLGLEADDVIPITLALPAPGQGALAVEVRADAPLVAELVAQLHDASTATAVHAERAVLSRLGGGCLLPVSAYGLVEDGVLNLEARVISSDGGVQIKHSVHGTPGDHLAMAAEVARTLLDQGAREILGLGA
ncbi:MAG TPA: hydroxymethylbilane synthase [Actinomycetota bacterium]|nr:hydroxymethylbilane synthase [Actinomycetota bacterium]